MKIEKVYIEAPNGVRLSQWINVTTQDGLVELEFQLTSEPQLGTWTIFTLINGLKTTQEFDVDEYVLPKFEVNIKSPSYILINATEFKIQVCGRLVYLLFIKKTH
ncbi:ovostatin homolog 2-like [Anneissia japonica]|uniref:ovostatin homolog 2-like n=1 Tax=Anneissia japonica TaxID=1529436 RepID=UPI0014255C1E|nr:ovostatin homolog 2-like [Anneissia japonica]